MSDGLGTIGRYLILFGVAIIVIGALLMLIGRFPVTSILNAMDGGSIFR